MDAPPGGGGAIYTDIKWNLKNALYALFVIGVWFGSTSSFEENDAWFPQPKNRGSSVAWVLMICAVVWVLAIFLDRC